MKHAARRRPAFALGAALGILLAAALPAAAAESEAIAAGTVAHELARQFDTHPLLMLGELHRSREIHAWLQQLLHDPAFICRADDVVVEFGNSRLQALADRYVLDGAALSETEIASLWRETLPPLTWNSPVYRAVYDSVRELNTRHVCTRPVRVVLADSPIDWAQVRTPEDFAGTADRDASYAATVEREVLAKGHRALLIAGMLHALKAVPAQMGDADAPTVAQRLERDHPGALFSVLTVPLPQVAQLLHLQAVPSLRVLAGSPLADASLQLVDFRPSVEANAPGAAPAWRFAPDKHWPALGDACDAIAYVGGNHSLYPDPTLYLDPDYRRELYRRADVIKRSSGQDFTANLDFLVHDGELARAGSAALTQAIARAVHAYAPNVAAPQYRYALADLDGDGRTDAIVSLDGPAFCDTRGCTLMVLHAGARTVPVRIATLHGVGEPIEVSRDRVHGWHTLIVFDGATPRALHAVHGVYPSALARQPAARDAERKGAQPLQLWR